MMAQKEILDLLKSEREKGNDNYFTSAEICLLLNNKHGRNLYREINQLARYDYLEVVAYSLIPLKRGFRYK